MEHLNNHEYMIKQAKAVAKYDIERGLNCDPTRHGALKKSAWAKYYNEAYYKPIEIEFVELGRRGVVQIRTFSKAESHEAIKVGDKVIAPLQHKGCRDKKTNLPRLMKVHKVTSTHIICKEDTFLKDTKHKSAFGFNMLWVLSED